jgi:uncharacterized membrane protein YbhN (UPF0104 family)
MLERVHDVIAAAGHAAQQIAHDAASIHWGWLVVGVALNFVMQGVRTRAWFNCVRAAYPDDRRLRTRDVASAYFAGAGLNGIIPARGGDVVKLCFLRRRIQGSRYATLAGTFIPETAIETALGIGLVVWAFARGFLPVPASPAELPELDVSLFVRHPVLCSAVTLAALGLTVIAVRRLRGVVRRVIPRIRQGMAIFARPRDFLVGVATWQLLARLIRLGSLACLMVAFGIPVTFASVVLVMAAQGSGRVIPIAPASAGLRLAMLSYGLIEVTNRAIDIERITVFSFGVAFALLIAGVTTSLVLIAREFGTLSPQRALAVARATLAERADAPAPAA